MTQRLSSLLLLLDPLAVQAFPAEGGEVDALLNSA